MKVAKLTQIRPTPFQGPLGGIGSTGDILSSTFIKLRDWILIEHKG